VYGDDRTEWVGDSYYYYSRPRIVDATPDYLRLLFDEQKRHPGYRALLDTNISIFGTIDDHDYGVNNGDNTFPWRRENTIEYVRFLGISEDSAMFRRAALGKGVYGVQVYDFERAIDSRTLSDEEAGLDPDVIDKNDNNNNSDRHNESPEEPKGKNRKVAVFVLDIRTNRTPWQQRIPDRFFTDIEGDFLGEEQWKWFETALGRSDAAVNIVVTGLQVHAERYFDPNVIENWHGFEKSQHRLYQALLQSNVQAPILISGDVHKAQLMRKDCSYYQPRHHQHHTPGMDSTSPRRIRPLYEITTSGMTHSWGTKPCGRANGNPLCHSLYHKTVCRLVLQFAHKICPWTELLLSRDDDDDDDARASKSRLQYSLELNVAELDFDWEDESVSVNILGVDGKNMLEQKWSFRDLTESRTTMVQPSEFDMIRDRRIQSKIIMEDSNEWICVSHRGIPNQYWYAIGTILPMTVGMIFMTLPFWLPFVVCLHWTRKLYTRRSQYRDGSKNNRNSRKTKVE